MTNETIRYVGNPDFHDGYVRGVSWNNDNIVVAVEGDSGKNYKVAFNAVSGVESRAPIGMMLYALAEVDAEEAPLLRYDFINWYFDEPEKMESKAYLRIIARGFSVAESE